MSSDTDAKSRSGPIDADAIFRKLAWRFLPLLTAAYMLNYIDRTNVSIAALTMNKDIGLSPAEYGWGAGILFAGYCLFEVPSNLVLYRVGATRWLSRIVITWGLISACMVFVQGPHSFYLIRFLLGVAEAGFYPGVVFFLSSWFPAFYRGRILGLFLVAVPGATFVGSLLSGLLLGLDGFLGLEGWKWLFLLESLPCIPIGILMLLWLRDTPSQAAFLSNAEKEEVARILAEEVRIKPANNMRAVLADARVWILSGIFFSFSIGSYGVLAWLPLFVQKQHFSNLATAATSGLPYLFAVFGMVWWGIFVDKHGKRVENVIVTCLLASAGFCIALGTENFVVSMVGITLALVGVNAARTVFWAIPPRYLEGVGAAGGLALINSIGTVAGFVAPIAIGILRTNSETFTTSFLGMAVFLLLGAFLSLILRLRAGAD
jgi:ACS family tartrate transporter-like MFS transporter